MEVFSQHLGEWLILILILGGLIYTLFIIGEEKSTFKDESYEMSFDRLKLRIPTWWTLTSTTDHKVRFERTDTRYDWFASFEYIPQSQDRDLPKILENKLNQEDIEFDKDVQFETDSRVLFRDSKVQEYFQEVIRVEGTASQNVVDRIYYDIYIVRGLGDSGHFIFESRSSVLNGLVEGPYFEEGLAELELKD
jgi:hypothetical protein